MFWNKVKNEKTKCNLGMEKRELWYISDFSDRWPISAVEGWMDGWKKSLSWNWSFSPALFPPFQTIRTRVICQRPLGPAEACCHAISTTAGVSNASISFMAAASVMPTTSGAWRSARQNVRAQVGPVVLTPRQWLLKPQRWCHFLKNETG